MHTRRSVAGRCFRIVAFGMQRERERESTHYDTCVNYLVLRSAVRPYPSARNPQIVNTIELKSQTWNSIMISLWCEYPFWLFYAFFFCSVFYVRSFCECCLFAVNFSSSNFRGQCSRFNLFRVRWFRLRSVFYRCFFFGWLGVRTTSMLCFFYARAAMFYVFFLPIFK